MAISINSGQTPYHVFGYRPIVWNVTSNDATVVRCICDVYINGVYKVSLDKSPDIGQTDVFTFNVAGVMQDYMSYHVPNFTNGTDAIHASTAGLNYLLKFYEVLDNGTTLTTTWAENGAGTLGVATSTYYVFNGTLKHEETLVLNDFIAGGTYIGLHKILTNQQFLIDGVFISADFGTNSNRYIKKGDFAILSGWYDSVASMRGRLYQWDSSITLISETTTTGVANTVNSNWHYAVDTDTLASNCAWITMRIETTATSSEITETTLFKVVPDCNDYVSLYWQNSVGGIDYYLFRDGQVKQLEGDTNTFKQPLTSSYNIYDFGTTVLNKKGTTGVSAVSEVIDRYTATWLSELFTHANRAWIFDGTNFIPVIVSDGSIATIDTNNGLYRAEIELTYSNEVISQRF